MTNLNIEIVLQPSLVVEVMLGTTGPQGFAGNSVYNVVANENIGGQRALTWAGYYLDQSTLDDYAGITISAVISGETANAQRLGTMQDASFSFTVGLPIFAYTNGLLTQIVSSLPLRRLGIASATDTIQLDPQPTIGV